MPLLERPFYRYDLTVDVPATEAAVLVDALAGEQLSLKTRLGWESLKAQIETEHRITIQVLADDAWPEFERDIPGEGQLPLLGEPAPVEKKKR